MIIKILIPIIILLIFFVANLYKSLMKIAKNVDELSLYLLNDKIVFDSNNNLICCSKEIHNALHSSDEFKEPNKDIINRMSNVRLIEFIKERFNLPDYCKMCDNFNPIDSDENICRFKGMFEIKCKEGFEKWVNNTNNLEGDMNADIN